VWRCPAYDPQRLLIENLSVATAVVRRAAFDRVGGYRTDMTRGLEDWDFWIGLTAAGYRGYCVPEPLFEYRRHAGGSMLAASMPHRAEMIRLIIRHHHPLYTRALGLAAARSRVDPQSDADDSDIEELYQAWLARRELTDIENSRSWRVLRWLDHGAADQADPRARLAQIKASRRYRLIQAAKRTPVYRWLNRALRGSEPDRLSNG